MHEDKKGLWMDERDDACTIVEILKISGLTIDFVETIDDALKEIEKENYDYFVLEPTIMLSHEYLNFGNIPTPFREKILNRLMEDKTKPIILATSFPEMWRGHKLTKNVAIVCKPTNAKEIDDTLNELFEKCRPL